MSEKGDTTTSITTKNETEITTKEGEAKQTEEQNKNKKFKPSKPSNRPLLQPTSGEEEEVESTRVSSQLTTKSIFHGTQFRDYQGRTFVDPPTTLKPFQHECFMPKRLLHTYNAHTKGVSAIRLFPKYGHILLSAGMDNSVKVNSYQIKITSHSFIHQIIIHPIIHYIFFIIILSGDFLFYLLFISTIYSLFSPSCFTNVFLLWIEKKRFGMCTIKGDA